MPAKRKQQQEEADALKQERLAAEAELRRRRAESRSRRRRSRWRDSPGRRRRKVMMLLDEHQVELDAEVARLRREQLKHVQFRCRTARLAGPHGPAHASARVRDERARRPGAARDVFLGKRRPHLLKSTRMFAEGVFVARYLSRISVTPRHPTQHRTETLYHANGHFPRCTGRREGSPPRRFVM